MLSSIHPFGERSRHNRWRTTVVWYLLGTSAGGVTTGAMAGAFGSLLGAALTDRRALVALAIGGFIGVALDLNLGGVRVPSIPRQVDERWLMIYRSWVYGIGFGYQLGLGVVTIVPTSAIWLTWLAAGLTGSAGTGAVIGLVFGIARGSIILLNARVEQPSQLRALHRRLASTARHAARITTAGLALTALIAAAAVLA